MTDFANLVLAIDSTSVKTGTASLDGLTAAGARAEAATLGMGKGSKAAAIEAAGLAASAQAAARAAVGQATGFSAVTSAIHGNTIAMRESLVVGRELLSGNLTRLPGSLSILAQQFAISGKSASSFASQILQSFGVIKSVTDAELASEAAAAAGAANAIRSVAARAVANVTAADTEVALARAAITTATTTEALAAAQVELAAAHGAVAAAAAEATVAEVALADAAAAEATAATAAASATYTALAPIGVILAGIAVAAGVAFGAFKLLQSDVQPEIDQFIDGLGLSKKEVEKLQDTSITFGDVMKGVWKTIADHTIADEALRDFKSFAVDQFRLLLKAGVDIFAELYGTIVGTYRAAIDIWHGFPSALGDAFYSAVNAGIGALNSLIQSSVNGLNSFIRSANGVLGNFGLHIADISAPQIAQISNQYAGAARKLVGDVSGEVRKATNEFKAGANALINETIRNIIDAAEDRIGSQAERAGAKARKAKEDVDHLAKALDQLQHLLFLFDNAKVEIDQGSLFENADLGLNKMLGNLPGFGNQLLDTLRQISDQAAITGQALADAFGAPGAAIGGLIANVARYGEEQERLSQAVAANTITQANADKALANLRLSTIATTISGLKTMFKEHSAGYKAMEAAEKAFAIIQAISTIKSVAAGAAKMFSQLGVWAFPAVGAMIAVMAGLGFSGGSSTQKAPTSAADLQAQQGAGTILGDSTAKSQSIANSLDIMAKNSVKGIDQSADMVRSLRSINSSIGNLAAAIGRMFQSGGAFDTAGLGLGTKSSGIQGLFGSKTTTSLYDQGIQFNSTSLASAIANGISGATYQIVETVKKNSGFLGIGGSTKTSYSTTYGSLDPDLQRQVGLILGSLRDSVIQAAKVLGLDVASALNTFQVEIGKISFEGLKGDEITQALQSVFSKVADQMAGFAVAGLEQFQKAGEGLFETLERLAKDYLTIDAALKSIGKTFGSVGSASIAMREKLIDLAGGLDQFVDQVNYFYDHFLTDSQKTAFLKAQVDATFKSLGLAVPTTIAGFAKLVTGANLSTDAGQKLFESLMQIAPAFYEVATAADQLASKAKDDLLQAYKRESAALQQTADKFHKFADSLQAFRDSLFTTGNGSLGYNGALIQLMKQAGLARGGDEGALGGGLQNASQQFLTIAEQNAHSLQDVERARAMVARYLDQAIGGAEGQASIAEQQLAKMKDQVGKLIDIDDHVLTVAEAIKALTAVLSPTAPATTRRGIVSGIIAGNQGATVAERLDNIRTAIEAIAVSTGGTHRILRNADRGGAIALVTDADSPIATTAA